MKAVLPSSCLWTALRECEGCSYEETLEELRRLYADDRDGSGIPNTFRQILGSRAAVEALGFMVWYTCIITIFVVGFH